MTHQPPPHAPLQDHQRGRLKAFLCVLICALTLSACDNSGELSPLDQGAPDQGPTQDAFTFGDQMVGGTGGEAGITAGEAGAMGGAPSDEALCEPCEVDAPNACPEGFVCHQPQAQEGAEPEAPFCTRPCAELACPTAYECAEPSAPVGGAEGAGGAEETGGTAGTDSTSGTDSMGAERLCLPVANSCSPVFCNDEDGDGYGRGRDCLGLDCDDTNPNVNPGVALDVCDGIDNNCNAEIDEDFVSQACGEGACAGVSACVMGEERCDAPMASGADDVCDGVDDDCDGSIDEGYVPEGCGQGICQALSACVMGVVSCEPTAPTVGDEDTTCDLIDSDCDGFVDEGFRGASCGVGACAQPARCTAEGISCTPGQATGNDSDCDGIDNDCDGRVDEGFMSDVSCGLGACRQPSRCVEGRALCEPLPPSSVLDNTCDGVDDDCNGVIDDACAENALTFSLVLNEPDALTIAVTLSRGAEVGPPNVQTLPSLLDLYFELPAGLALAPNGISLGASPLGLGITERVNNLAPTPGLIRVLFPISTPLGYEAMLPGELIRFRLTKQGGALSPYAFNWRRAEPCQDSNNNGVCEPSSGETYTDSNNNGRHDANTSLSPPSAQSILTLHDAQLGAQ